MVRRFADNLIRHARDTYGPEPTGLFVSQWDIGTQRLLPADTKLYATDTRGGAGPHMNNLQFDGGLLRLLYGLSEVTGEAQYADAADAYLRHYLANLPDERGFFPWGDHRGFDLVARETVGGPHEFKVTYPPWDAMYRINPEAVRRQIEALKLHIIDESRSYGFNRHYPPGRLPHSMNSSGGAYIAAWAFLYKKTGERKYLEWAHGMADYLWSLRDPRTDLLAAHPYDPAYPEAAASELAKARASRTEYMGQIAWYGPNLLRTSLVLGDEEGARFRRQALAYYRAFVSRMDVQPDGSFYATFDLATGKPRFAPITEGWELTPQVGHPIAWSNGVVGLRALASLGFAYKVTRQPELRETFDRLIPLIRMERFADLDGEPQPIAAGLLAQVMVGLLNMHQASGDARYLDDAWKLARYAMAHFYRDGWFVCGEPIVPRYRDPQVDVWRTYSNRGGSNDLALAVLRVHLVRSGLPDPAEDDVGSHF